MLMLFWSPHPGKSGLSTAIASIGTYLALGHSASVLMGHTLDGDGAIGDLMVSETQKAHLSNIQGLETLLLMAKNGLLEGEVLKSYTLPLLSMGSLDYLNGVRVGANEPSHQEFLTVLKRAKEMYDYVLIEAKSGCFDPFSEDLMGLVDHIVIGMPQRRPAIAKLTPILLQKRVTKPHILLVGRYYPTCKYNLYAIERESKKCPIIVLPEHSALTECSNDGQMVAYFGRQLAVNNQRSLREPNPFFEILHKSVQKITKLNGR